MSGEKRLALVGAGNMGGAMLAGWLEAGRSAQSIVVVDPVPPEPMRQLIGDHGLALHETAEEAGPCDIIVVAVKPQIIGKVLPGLAPMVGKDTVLASVAAGTTMAQLAEPFGQGGPKIVRAMPNTPAQVGRGISVCVGDDNVTGGDRETLSGLLEAIGQVRWIDDEALMDAVTGVSGSGPAYIFHLAEAMAQAGVTAGLPRELADDLARATVCGAGELLYQSPLSPGELRKNVTSPNGTTAAALEVLMADDGFTQLLTRAVAAAAKRSEELSEG